MDHVFMISVSDIAASFLDFLGFIWGWLVTGGLIRLGWEIGKFLLYYEAKKSLDRGEPQKALIHLKHFVHNHEGIRPSQCTEGLCGAQDR